jgi:hypothetical protein
LHAIALSLKIRSLDNLETAFTANRQPSISLYLKVVNLVLLLNSTFASSIIVSIPLRVKFIRSGLIIPRIPNSTSVDLAVILPELNSINPAFNHPFNKNRYFGGIGTLANNQS